ncbi:MAG TPA: zinc ribbon domain-containing protein [Dehalococcoidia bacterium]|nr:zinc ribbon domain-containing protein [Dehalococcoidia bacterium]
MPVYEYYCEKDKKVFEALGSIARSDAPAKCPKCGAQAYRIMPTTFASLSRVKGLKERVPFHHHPVRNEAHKRAIAPVKPQAKKARTTTAKPKTAKKR